MDTKLYLSICIPTYNRLEILEKSLESIYYELKDVSLENFEIVISDNEPNQSARKVVEKFNFKNIHYYSTDSPGFLNSLNVLKCARGLFLKLHNNYTKFRPGSLKKMIDEIKENISEKPVIFYTNGLNQYGKIRIFNSFDSFMYHLSYLSSWSTSFGIWKEDFDECLNSIEIDTYFPQTSLLLAQAGKTKFIINDIPIYSNQNVPNKGGYNIFKVFSIDYISLIEQSFNKNIISSKTFLKIKHELLYDYLSSRYFKTVMMKLDNFEKTNIKQNLMKYYSPISFYFMIVIALFSPIKYGIRKLKIAVYNNF